MNLNFWRKENNSSEDRVENVSPEYGNFEYRSDASESEGTTGDDIAVEDRQIEPADPEKAKFYNNVSRWAIYAGIFLLPLLFLPWTSSLLEMNKQMALMVVAGVALVSWLLGIVSSGYLAWRRTPLDMGVLGVLIAFSLATVFSIAKFKSLFGLNVSLSNSLVSIVALTVLYFLIVNNVEDKGKFIKSLVGLSLILAIGYGLLQMFGIYVIRLPFTASRAFNTVGSINTLGILAAMALPLFSKSKFDLRFLKNLYLEKVGVVLSLLFLVLVNWWVLWVVAIAGMVAMIALENIGGGRPRMAKFVLPMTVIVLAVFLMVVRLDFRAFKQNLPIEVSPSTGLSVDIIKSVVKEKKNIAFGYGPENFSIAFDKYGAGKLANTTLKEISFLDANSEAMTLIVHGGLVMVAALAFLLWSVGIVFWKFHRYAAKSRAEDPSGQDLVAENMGILSSLAAITVALFLFPFNLTLMLSLYVFMGLAALVIFDKNRKEFNIEEKVSLSLASSLGFIGGLILVLVGVYFYAIIYVGDVRYAKAFVEKDNEKVASILIEAINWNNQDDRYYRSASQAVLNLLAIELNKSDAGGDKVQNYITTSISFARRATEINPREALNWSNLGFIYQNLIPFVDGIDKLSEDAYVKAGELRPGDPSFPYRIGLLYLAKFDLLRQLVATRRADAQTVAKSAQEAIQKAEESFRKAVDFSPTFGLAIYNLGVAYDRQGELGEAIQQLEKIIPFNSNNPGLNFELGLLYYRAGRKNDALSQLQRVVVLAPDYANARWYLALIYEERKDLNSAIGQLEKILSVEINKDNSVVTAKLGELKSGKTRIPPEGVLDQKPLQ